MKRLIIISAVMLILTISLSAETELKYGNISYGITIEEFQEIYGADYKETEYHELRFGFFQSLLNSFENSFSRWRTVGMSFDNEITKLLRKIDNETGITTVAYFSSTSETTRLFMVEKRFKSEYGDYVLAFDTIEGQLTGIIGTHPQISEGYYSNLYMENNNLIGVGKVGIWNKNNEEIFLALGSDTVFIQDKLFIYRDKQEWSSYTDSIAQKREKRKEEEENKQKQSTANF